MGKITASLVICFALTVGWTLAAGQATAVTDTSRFEIRGGESSSFGFGVSQPGSISVDATWQGPALIMTLIGPSPHPVETSGSGSLRLQYTVTQQEIQRGVLWRVTLRPVQPIAEPVAPPGKIVIIDSQTQMVRPTGVVASGTLHVQHPPVDKQRMQAEIATLARKHVSKTGAVDPQGALLLKQALEQRKQQYETATSKQREERVQALRAQLNTGSASSTQLKKQRLSVDPSQIVVPRLPGSSAPAPDPTLSSLSVNSGSPGDPVLLTGSGFQDAPGEVHFIINQGMDVKAAVDAWTDTQILAYVPTASGIQDFDGEVYVINSGGKRTSLFAFHFNPTMDFAQLMPDGNDGDWILHRGILGLGAKDDDEFWNNLTTLKNGWTVDSVALGVETYLGGAYVTESRVDTNSPYVKVHWWCDTTGFVKYMLAVNIKGPKGVSYK